MNYLHHPNLLVQFWASVNTEFDKILDSFVRNDGWLFQDLGVVAKKANIGAIYRCVCTLVNGNQGKAERLDHFIRTNYVILDAAKTQWLVPWRTYVVDPSKGAIPPFLKRQVGGFFLLYMLFTNQPLPNRTLKKQRIMMDSRDLLAMHVFNATMQRLPKADDQFRELGRQLVIIFNDLVTSEAFEFTAVNESFATPNPSVRQLLANKFCIFTKMIYTLKDVRDQLQYITYQENPKVFQSLVNFGKFLPQKMPKKKKSQLQGNTTGYDEDIFCPVDKKWSVEEIKAMEGENDIGKIAHSVSCILRGMDFGPILTRERITGIADNLLDKELNGCAKTYRAYTKLCDDSSNRYRIRSYKYRDRRVRENPNSSSAVVKNYFSDKYDWIDDVFRDVEYSFEPAPQKEGDPLTTDERDVIELSSGDDEDDEWMTEDSDLEDVVVDSASLDKQQAEVINSKTASPRKRSQRVLSMPTIL